MKRFAATRRNVFLSLLPGLLTGCLATGPLVTYGPDHEAQYLQRRLRLQGMEARQRYDEAIRRHREQAERDRLAALTPRPAAALVAAMKTGLYQCDLQRQVELLDISDTGMKARMRWLGQDYEMDAVLAATGALRLENRQAGLVWLTIVGKSMLLDARDGRQLANDCRKES